MSAPGTGTLLALGSDSCGSDLLAEAGGQGQPSLEPRRRHQRGTEWMGGGEQSPVVF